MKNIVDKTTFLKKEYPDINNVGPNFVGFAFGSRFFRPTIFYVNSGNVVCKFVIK